LTPAQLAQSVEATLRLLGWHHQLLQFVLAQQGRRRLAPQRHPRPKSDQGNKLADR
jgi:hypothetical protein